MLYRRLSTIGLALMVVGGLLLPTAFGQPLAYDGQGITLRIVPQATWIGGQIVLNGVTAPAQNDRMMTARFEPPRGAPFTRRFPMTADGTYAHVESDLEIDGTWTVHVKGPLVEEVATGTFEVQQVAVVVRTSVSGFSDGAAQAGDFLDVLETEIEQFPELPDREAALQAVREARASFAGFGAGYDSIADALQQVERGLPALAPFPEAQEAMNDLAAALSGAAQNLETIRQELYLTHEQANQAREWCRMWHAQKQGLQYLYKMVAFMLDPSFDLKDWVETKMATMVNGVRDKVYDQAAIDAMGLTEKQVADVRKALGHYDEFENVVKIAAGDGGTLDSKKGDYAEKAVQWIINWISAKVAPNCRMYDAKLKGHLRIDYYTKGVVYMVAKYRFEGKVELFFQKRQAETDKVQLKGQLWGKFDWRIGQFFPERVAADIPGVTGLGLCIPRPPTPDIRDFYLTLEGEGFPDAVEVEITGVNYDWERLPYQFISVLWSPYQMVPAVDFPKMDVPGGHWFVTRVTGATGEKTKFRIPLEVSNDKVIMKHTFKRTMNYVKQNEFFGVLTLDVDGEESKL